MSSKRHLFHKKTFEIREPLSLFNADEKEFQKPAVTEVIKTQENNCHTLPFNGDKNINEEDSNSFQYSLPFEMDKSSDNFYFCFPVQNTSYVIPKVTLNKKVFIPKKNDVYNKFTKTKKLGLHKSNMESSYVNKESNLSKDNYSSNTLMKFYTKRDIYRIYSNRNKKIKLSFNKNNKCMSTSRKKNIVKKNNSSDKDNENCVKNINKNIYNNNKSNIDTNYSTKIENENTKDHLSNFLDSPVNLGSSAKYYFTQTQNNFNSRKPINNSMYKNKDMKILIVNGNGNKTEYNSQKKLKTQENLQKTSFHKKNGFLQFQNLGNELGAHKKKQRIVKTMKNLKYSPKLKNFQSKLCQNNNNKSVGMKINITSSIDKKNKTCITNNNSNKQLKKIKVNLKKTFNHHYNYSIQDQFNKNDLINEEIHIKEDNLYTNRKNKIKLNEFNLCYTKKRSIDSSKNFETLEEKSYNTKLNKSNIYQRKCGIDSKKKIINLTGKKLEFKSKIFKKNLFNISNDNQINSFDFDKNEIITYNILRNNHYNIIANEVSISLSKENQLLGFDN